MGLDIYVRWDGMTKEERDAQITGFADAPEAGYLRASWPGYSVLSDISAQTGIVLPLVGYHAYGDGGNGGEVAITDEVMAQLREWRQQWLEAAERPIESASSHTEYFRGKLRISAAMVDFIEARYTEGKTGISVDYA